MRTFSFFDCIQFWMKNDCKLDKISSFGDVGNWDLRFDSFFVTILNLVRVVIIVTLKKTASQVFISR